MIELLRKTYDGESLCDVDRDVFEALSSEYNNPIDEIPVDEYGIAQGIFTVIITWSPHD